MKSVLIKIQDLRRFYDDGNIAALQGVNLTVHQGELLAIEGPSGSGKSTLLNILGGLDTEFEGEVLVAEANLRKLEDSARYRSRVVGFIFQSFHLLSTLTALENVQVPMFEMEWSAKERRARAIRLLESLGLADRLHHVPSHLSGGERQRVAIARSLANGARLLLADEPTGNLDSANSEHIMDLLWRIHEEEDVTMLVVTHDPLVAARAARVVRMLDGRVVGDRLLKMPD